MTWLTKLRTYLGHDETITSADASSDDEARQYYEKAQAALGEARQRREDIREVSTSLAELRVRNHFGESIELAMMRREKHA